MRRTVLVALTLAALLAFGIVFEPAAERWWEDRRLRQEIALQSGGRRPVGDILQELVDRADVPVEVDLCASLVLLEVQLPPAGWKPSVSEAIAFLAAEANAPVRWHAGIHGEIASPAILCPAGVSSHSRVLVSQRARGSAG